MAIETVALKQQEFFLNDNTKSVKFRTDMLKNLLKAIIFYEDDIFDALKKDLNKSKHEAYMTEVAIVKGEIGNLIKNLRKWDKEKSKTAPITHFPAKSRILREPYGNVLIMAPWNYPFQLAMLPLAGAIAGGNTAVLKPSRKSGNTFKIIEKIIKEAFSEEYVYCASNEISNEEILGQKYDLIFFTGSASAGKTVLRAAAENLTPAVLELGGKSPCIVEKSANLKIAARKIAWGKYLNSGQTCVAPDYVLVDKKIKNQFVKLLKEEIVKQYGNAYLNEDYCHIINEHHFDRLCNILNETDSNKIWGGKAFKESLCIEPAVIEDATWEDEAMKEEIFGPILPVITYDDLNQVKREIKRRERPLALYIFSEDKRAVDDILNSISFGGGCVNDCIMHVANDRIPFGGTGQSGMGAYHGKYSFEAFTREKAVEIGGTKIDLHMRYQPYTPGKMKIVEKVMK